MRLFFVSVNKKDKFSSFISTDFINKKENEPSIPATGMAVLRQQYVLVEAIQAWIASLKKNIG